MGIEAVHLLSNLTKPLGKIRHRVDVIVNIQDLTAVVNALELFSAPIGGLPTI